MKKISVEATVSNLYKVLSFINQELEAHGCRMKPSLQIDVAVEELFVNIAHYAYTPETGIVTISIDIYGDPAVCEITFKDSGIPYDPVSRQDPDVTLDADERSIGGLGIFMVKQSMDELLYEYRDGHNITTIRKYI